MIKLASARVAQILTKHLREEMLRWGFHLQFMESILKRGDVGLFSYWIYGFDIDAKHIKIQGHQLMYYAIKSGNPGMVEALWSRGVDLDEYVWHKEVGDELKPVHIATLCFNLPILELLHSKGANLGAPSRTKGGTALDLMIQLGLPCGHTEPRQVMEIIFFLLEKGVKISSVSALFSEFIDKKYSHFRYRFLFNLVDYFGLVSVQKLVQVSWWCNATDLVFVRGCSVVLLAQMLHSAWLGTAEIVSRKEALVFHHIAMLPHCVQRIVLRKALLTKAKEF